ncbi:hypothetical protein MGN70_013731 [Eutypa lata]|nr:hypothetical protein MGN70_013731 [Eutypa lata]
MSHMARKAIQKKAKQEKPVPKLEGKPGEKPRALTTWASSNVTAGSDFVKTIIRTTMYNLLRYPYTLQALYKKLLTTGVSYSFPRYNKARNLPYLDAGVQEAIYMYPPFALPFERVVPKGGVSIFGHYIPEGTNLRGNFYAVNRHKGTFKKDAEF